jgi:hypothetical protein
MKNLFERQKAAKEFLVGETVYIWYIGRNEEGRFLQVLQEEVTKIDEYGFVDMLALEETEARHIGRTHHTKSPESVHRTREAAEKQGNEFLAFLEV